MVNFCKGTANLNCVFFIPSLNANNIVAQLPYGKVIYSHICEALLNILKYMLKIYFKNTYNARCVCVCVYMCVYIGYL